MTILYPCYLYLINCVLNLHQCKKLLDVNWGSKLVSASMLGANIYPLKYLWPPSPHSNTHRAVINVQLKHVKLMCNLNCVKINVQLQLLMVSFLNNIRKLFVASNIMKI